MEQLIVVILAIIYAIATSGKKKRPSAPPMPPRRQDLPAEQPRGETSVDFDIPPILGAPERKDTDAQNSDIDLKDVFGEIWGRLNIPSQDTEREVEVEETADNVPLIDEEPATPTEVKQPKPTADTNIFALPEKITADKVAQGVVWAEILGRPKAFRHRGR